MYLETWKYLRQSLYRIYGYLLSKLCQGIASRKASVSFQNHVPGLMSAIHLKRQICRYIHQKTNLPMFHKKPEKMPGAAASWAAKSGTSHDDDRYGKAVAIGVKIATAIPKDGKNALPCKKSPYVLSVGFAHSIPHKKQTSNRNIEQFLETDGIYVY